MKMETSPPRPNAKKGFSPYTEGPGLINTLEVPGHLNICCTRYLTLRKMSYGGPVALEGASGTTQDTRYGKSWIGVPLMLEGLCGFQF